MDIFVPILLSVALLLGLIGLFFVFSRKKSKFDLRLREEVKKADIKIGNLLRKNNIDLKKQALIVADKTLDSVLKTVVTGKDMGGRLKNARKLFSDDESLYQQIWEAHKTRNKVVHQVDFSPKSDRLVISINSLRRGWKYLGY
ncbi:MAG: hypothetical protein ACOZAR_04715 [Patescibacteria group bacterium]